MIKTRHTQFLTRIATAAALGLPLCAAVPAAFAQRAGDDVEVNLNALGLGGAQAGEPRLVLKYPGASTATRQVPQLRYPDVPEPVERPAPPKTSVKATPAATGPAFETTQIAPQEPEPAAVSEQPNNAPAGPVAPAMAATPDKPAPEKAAPEELAQAPEPASAPVPSAEPAPAPAAAAAPAPAESQIASLEAPPATSQLADPEPSILSVMFDSDTAAIIGTARSQLDSIAETLRYDPRRIELKAFGGDPGDKTSDARRLSLKRGLAVRAYLIGLGIDSRRIDVRALGGITDSGAPDRVDLAYSGG